MDFEHLPKGSMGWDAFVDSLTKLDDFAESHFLEMKSDVDLTGRAGSAKVAKFILGAANRMPDTAASKLDGHAVMVLGIGPGSRSGIAPIENHDLRRRIDPFVGIGGPRWDVERVAGEDGRHVLVVIVDPPSWGEPPYPCQQSSGDLIDGDIYVRAHGETRRANGAEVRLLVGRATKSTPAQPQLELDLGGPVRAYSCDPAAIETALSARVGALLATLPATRPYLAAKIGDRPEALLKASVSNALWQTVMEKRTPGEFRQQVTDWATACREALPSLVERFVQHHVLPTTVTVRNLGTEFLEGVEISLHIEGAVIALDSKLGERYDESTWFPAEPREFGDYKRGMLGAGVGPGIPFGDFVAPRPVLGTKPAIRYSNGGSVTITLSLPELRPLAAHAFKKHVCLVVRDAGLRELHGTWRATAKGRDAVIEGETVVPVQEPAALDDGLAKVAAAAWMQAD